MQRLEYTFGIILIFLALLIVPQALSGQNYIPNLNEYSPSPRVFAPIGCRGIGLNGHEHREGESSSEVEKRLLVDNYDMSESISRSDTFDIEHYEVDLDLTNYSLQQIKGRALITLTVIENGASDIWFDFVGLTTDSINIDGTTSDFAHENGRLIIPGPGEIVEGEELPIFTLNSVHEIEVFYSGHPDQDPYWGGVYFAAGYIFHMGIGLTSMPPNYGKVWHPCFDNFVERATYTWNIRSAGGRKAHLQGTFLGEVQEAGDTLTRSFTLQHPITTHCAAFAVADYVDSNYVHTGEYGEIPVRLTAKPEDINQMANKFSDLGYAIDALEFWWGPYAWERVGYVITTDGALEVPTNVSYPKSMIGESSFANGDLYAHELGHHWWGDLVAPTVHNHMWLKEGPAEYSSHLFFELKDGHREFIDGIKDNQKFVLEECHIQDEGFHPLSPMPDEQIYGRTTYYKGASIHHNLRAYLGDEMYRNGCQDVIATHFDSHMDADLFRSTLEDVTGMDLDPFFDAQVYQPGFSTWLIDSTLTVMSAEGNAYETTLYLNQKLRACSNFHDNEPLDVTLWNSDWDTTLVQIRVGGEYDEATIFHPEPFELIALNADGKLNQGRLDNTFVISETTGLSTIPWVEIRLGCDIISDSVLVRVEHHWAAPDSEPLDFYFDEISSTHFWTIDGTWENGIEGSEDLTLDARFSYVGNNEEGLDFELFNGGEEDAFLAWRQNSSSTWVQYPDYAWQSGSLSNGNGVFKVSSLRKGQYAFANGNIALSIDLDSPDIQSSSAIAYPSPASSNITLENPHTQGNSGFVADALKVWDSSGRLVFCKTLFGNEKVEVDLQGWGEGNYFAVWFSGKKSLNSTRFIVAK